MRDAREYVPAAIRMLETGELSMNDRRDGRAADN